MWKNWKKIAKFTKKEFVDELLGPDLFRVNDRQIYYYGSGFILSFTSRKFRIENQERVVYGEEGLFLVNIYHFVSKELLMRYLNIDTFDCSDTTAFEEDIIEGCVNYSSNYSDIYKSLKIMDKDCFFQAGEDRILRNGEFVFSNRYIFWDSFGFLFEKDSDKAILSGFQYSPQL